MKNRMEIEDIEYKNLTLQKGKSELQNIGPQPGLSSPVHCAAVVPAIRCKSGTEPALKPSPGFPLLSGSPAAAGKENTKN